VGGIQFEKSSIKALASQSIHNQRHIDDKLMTLVAELSNYIGEAMNIIRNHKLLTKFKDFIFKEVEVELKPPSGSKRKQKTVTIKEESEQKEEEYEVEESNRPEIMKLEAMLDQNPMPTEGEVESPGT